MTKSDEIGIQLINDQLDALFDEELDEERRFRALGAAFIIGQEVFHEPADDAMARLTPHITARTERLDPLATARFLHFMGNAINWLVEAAAEDGITLSGLSDE